MYVIAPLVFLINRILLETMELILDHPSDFSHMENNMVETEKNWPNLQNKWLFALRQVGLVFLWSYSAAPLSTRSQKNSWILL